RRESSRHHLDVQMSGCKFAGAEEADPTFNSTMGGNPPRQRSIYLARKRRDERGNATDGYFVDEEISASDLRSAGRFSSAASGDGASETDHVICRETRGQRNRQVEPLRFC